jgi:hypothetical protein
MPKMSSTVTMDKKSVLSIPPSQEILAKVTEMNNLTINTVNTSLMISKSSQPRKIDPKTTQPLCNNVLSNNFPFQPRFSSFNSS